MAMKWREMLPEICIAVGDALLSSSEIGYGGKGIGICDCDSSSLSCQPHFFLDETTGPLLGYPLSLCSRQATNNKANSDPRNTFKKKPHHSVYIAFVDEAQCPPYNIDLLLIKFLLCLGNEDSSVHSTLQSDRRKYCPSVSIFNVLSLLGSDQVTVTPRSQQRLRSEHD
jgi:hypothetical protein